MRILILLCALLLSSAAHAAAPKLKVVTSFSILEDIAKQIGGDRVEVTSLVGRNTDIHSYEPKPSDVVALRHADLFIINGLGLEGFITRLMESAEFKGQIVEATLGIKKIKNTDPEEIEEHGEFDPHAWQSIKNGAFYARNIATAFAAKDPEHAKYYNERLKGYILRINELNAWAYTQIAKVPPTKRSIIVAHEGFAYLGQDYGIRMVSIEKMGTQAETSAKKIVSVLNAIRQSSVHAMFMEHSNFSSTNSWICAEAKIPCGILYSDALTEKTGKAYTYFELFQNNIEAIVKGLK
jgi:zinc/manganese transport system substrate-binding protein